MTELLVFPILFIALVVGHDVGDHWIQTDHQAACKGDDDWHGRLQCALHVVTYTATQLVAIAAVWLFLDVPVTAAGLTVGLAVSAGTHYWADRRTTLRKLCALFGNRMLAFYELGAPRAGRDDNPSIGTGAYALDQSWHKGWLFVSAIVMAAMA